MILRAGVCTENLILIDYVPESLNVNGDDRAALLLLHLFASRFKSKSGLGGRASNLAASRLPVFLVPVSELHAGARRSLVFGCAGFPGFGYSDTPDRNRALRLHPVGISPSPNRA